MERLQKFISRCGYASRRKAEQLILDGKVQVNGRFITELGFKVNPERDRVKVEGHLLKIETLKYFLLNKPKGVVTTVSDQFERDTVMNYIKNCDVRVYPVGRLDYNTEGLLLLTNDGELAQGLMHPSKEVNKTYEVKIQGVISDVHLQNIADGVMLDGKITAPAIIQDFGFNGKNTIIEITIHEGRNRQIRRMFEKFGYRIQNLKRTHYAGLTLSGVKRGSYRELTKEEVSALKELV